MDLAFHRLAVINRGEAAMRLINAVQELRFEHGIDVRTIALHTTAEASAMFVREADEAICIDVDRPADAGSPYLDLEVLESALIDSRADAAWVGWGFVAERPEFAELCERLGVVFIGPRPEVMRRLGDKIEAKLLAERSDVPVAPWSGGPVDSIEVAREQADAIGFPLMIKATAGGGGRGIRRVDEHGGLDEAFRSARAEGLKAFGDATVFMERVVSDARHVEVQVICDTHGTAWAVGVRDCSLQRRNQKVVEESHCIVLTPEQDRDLRAAAVRLAQAAGYENAGTVEFLYQPAEQTFAFLEVNTRLQVEHPVTELTTGLDLVKLQLAVASGGQLVGDPPPSFGYAIEARLNAEDPQRGFAPAPGTIETLSLPVGSGIRVDTGVAEGDVIPPEFDSMIAKIIATGADRTEALSRLRRALSQMTVLVSGGTTNKSFLLELLDRDEVRSGDVDTSWLDRLTAEGGHLPTRLADVALIAATLDAEQLQADFDRVAFFGSASRGRPQVETAIGHTVELRYDGEPYLVEVRHVLEQRYELTVDGATVIVDVERLGRSRSRLTIGSTSYSVVSTIQGSDHLIEVEGIAHRFSRDDAGVVRAPAASLVVRIDVEADDVVAAGDRLGVLEAMKMEMEIIAPVSGRIRDVFSMPNAQVVAGFALFRIEPEGDDGDASTGRDRITFDTLAAATSPGDRRSNGSSAADLVSASLLGFDVSSAHACDVVASSTSSGDGIDAEDLVAILEVFADLNALAPERLDVSNEQRAGREYFNAYLRSLDPVAEGVPQWYSDRLVRALAHYGVSDLEPSDRLRDAVHRIFVSHQRRDEQLAIVAALLDDPTSSPGLRSTLDRVIDATRRRSPAVASMSRSVRYRLFDRPHTESARTETSAMMKASVAAVDGSPGEHAAETDRLIACPLPLLPILTEDDVFATTETPGRLVEILVRRYYRIRDLGPVTTQVVDDLEICRATYVHRGRHVHVIAVRAPHDALTRVLAALAGIAATVPATDTAVMDVFVPLTPTGNLDTDELSGQMRELLDRAEFSEVVRRVAVVPAMVGSRVDVLTFRRATAAGDRPYWMAESSNEAPDGDPVFEEDIKFRGLHPMIARRLQMWRLANFDISPLPAAGEAHLFDCVARENPADRRLIAVAEVRDITPIRDEAGKVVALPEVEHLLIGCLDAIRRVRGELPGAAALEWNRVMMYVWPVVDFPLDELDEVVQRLAPLTEGLGLEQVVVSGRLRDDATGNTIETVMRIGFEPGRGITVRITDPATEPMQPLDEYARKLIATRRRGLTYPYEIVPMLTRANGTFVEHDLDEQEPDGSTDRLVPAERPPGENPSGVVVGTVSTPTAEHPDGMTRVAILGDPTKAMGSITEAECRRLLAAIDLAAELDVPIEWFALSAGAKISMESGSENLDWVARVLRRIIEHTQAGGEINIVVAGINVGAQPYWNAESTMLMHTKGILVMTPDSAMVLTGKQAIDYSGGVSADDNFGIGGYERIMGPNGEAQFWAPTLAGACDVLFHHYDLTYRAPGERWPRAMPTGDPVERDVRSAPHDVEGIDFSTVGDIFSDTANPDRKKPFDIRAVMAAVIDADHEPLERWPEMADAEMAVVYDCRLGGSAITLIGMESRPLPRHGVTPADGPSQWSAGTLFPLSSKKVARAINAASGARPVVMLANLSGFDGSPESLRRLQLEYGAEIGRAIVNFDGPFVLCVVSRYHGGAFVVFSATLNDNMEVLAVEGSFASVIGGAPAAAVVFTRDVDARTRDDERIRQLDADVATAERDGTDQAERLRAELSSLRDVVRTEKMGDVAAEFDAVHSVERAQRVGSVHRIIAAADLRPELIASVARGMDRQQS
ncbi:biotin carboxylase N-terminal domain-containing protein [Ilumatobacter sp.]|uniref:ATP-binding protein n=1 Tax=Ilumatobacter sp. TaxID=1967498 RepID=UPI003C65F7E2